MENDKLGLSGTVFAIGNARFILEMAVPISEALERLPDEFPESFRRVESKHAAQGRPVASFLSEIESAVIIGVTFGGTVVLGRVIEKIWDERLWPLINDSWSTFTGQARDGRLYALGIAANVEERDLTILVAALGKTAEEVAAQQLHIPKVVSKASQDIGPELKGVVLLYLLEEGAIGAPEIFADTASALNRLSRSIPIKSPIYIRPES